MHNREPISVFSLGKEPGYEFDETCEGKTEREKQLNNFREPLLKTLFLLCGPEQAKMPRQSVKVFLSENNHIVFDASFGSIQQLSSGDSQNSSTIRFISSSTWAKQEMTKLPPEIRCVKKSLVLKFLR